MQTSLFSNGKPERVIIVDLNSVAFTAYSANFNNPNKMGVWINPQNNEVHIQPYDTRGLKYLDTFMLKTVLQTISTWSAKGRYPVYCFVTQVLLVDLLI